MSFANILPSEIVTVCVCLLLIKRKYIKHFIRCLVIWKCMKEKCYLTHKILIAFYNFCFHRIFAVPLSLSRSRILSYFSVLPITNNLLLGCKHLHVLMNNAFILYCFLLLFVSFWFQRLFIFIAYTNRKSVQFYFV